MTDKRTIGELIENEVRKQQIPITEFAKMICCQRNNVYDIFRRSKMDIIQLKQISKVLNRNFFKELAEDIELINDSNDSEEDVLRRRAVSQFLDVVPKVLHKLGKPTAIVVSKWNEPDNEGCATPDFGLSDYFITFTIGDTLKERIGDCALLSITSVSDGDDCVVEVCTNVVYDSVCINVRLDYKTEEEWYKILNFAFDIYSQKTIHINKGFMKTENDSHEVSVRCGKVADSMEKLEMLCQKEAEKLLTSLEVPVGVEVSIPFWTSDIPELICVAIFKRNENGIIVYELDFSESTL